MRFRRRFREMGAQQDVLAVSLVQTPVIGDRDFPWPQSPDARSVSARREPALHGEPVEPSGAKA